MDESKQVEVAQAIKNAGEMMKNQAYIELIHASARESFFKYTAYVKAGFTADQALQLVIHGVK